MTRGHQLAATVSDRVLDEMEEEVDRLRTAAAAFL
jgi:hypothetical protein